VSKPIGEIKVKTGESLDRLRDALSQWAFQTYQGVRRGVPAQQPLDLTGATLGAMGMYQAGQPSAADKWLNFLMQREKPTGYRRGPTVTSPGGTRITPFGPYQGNDYEDLMKGYGF